MRILGIDPGNNCGWAVVDEKGYLCSCGLGEPPNGAFSLVVLERPQVYPQTGTKQANDLITVAIGVGRLAERYRLCELLLVLPHTWKGTVPKPIHNRRVLAQLNPTETIIYHADVAKICESKRNNVIDAIGLAKYGYRINRGKGDIGR